MNKRTMLISFLILLSFVLAACQQEPERMKSKNQEEISSSAKGITIQLEKEQYTTKDPEVKFTLHNDNDSETTFLYGKGFLLEKNVNSTWYDVPLKEGMGFTTEGYNLIPGQTVSETISLHIFNEELSAGDYRIIKEFSDSEKEYSPENEIMIAASFELIES